jgi:hypothetical protein
MQPFDVNRNVAKSLVRGVDQHMKSSFVFMLKRLALETNEAEFNDAADLVYKIYLEVLNKQEFHFGIKIIEIVERIKNSQKNPSQSNAVLLQKFYGRLLSRETVHCLRDLILKDKSPLTDSNFLLLVKQFEKEKMQSLVHLLPAVDKATRVLVCNILLNLELVGGRSIVRLVQSDNEYVVSATLASILKRPDRDCINLLYQLCQHEDIRVRIEVVQTMRHEDTQTAKVILNRALYDQERSVRAAALTIIVDRGERPYAAGLIGVVRCRDFGLKDFDERRSTYLALATIAGDEVVEIFSDILLRKNIFNNTEELEYKFIAVDALVRIGTESAFEVLRQTRGKRFLNKRLRSSLTDQMATIGL